jgi:hypothetical protein
MKAHHSLKFYNSNIFLKVADYNLRVGWTTTSDSVENAYLLHSDVILQIQARWITIKAPCVTRGGWYPIFRATRTRTSTIVEAMDMASTSTSTKTR